MNHIRSFEHEDWASLWEVIRPVFRSGETYVYSPDTSEDEAREIWVGHPDHIYVAADEDNEILGTYYLKPNQPDLGAHVCNCGYIVSMQARGRGIASEMCRHSQVEAVSKGFRAMYNLVVSTNEGAIRLWQKHGFAIVGTLPGAFRHPSLGFVDTFVMYKQLVSS